MAAKKRKTEDDGVLARNRHASHEYEILETFEAGLELHGSEVKSLRAGRAQLREGYVRVERGEAWLINVHVGEYEQANRMAHEADRRRRLLLHRREIDYLDAKVHQQGLTMVPLRLYTKNNRIKLLFGLCRGKRTWDKRQAIAARDVQRETDRVIARARRAG